MIQGALLLLLGLKKRSESFFTGLVVLVVALMGTHFLIVPTGLITILPHLSGVIFPLIFILGPLLYILSKISTTDMRSGYMVHLIPFIIVVLILVPFFINSPSEKIAFMENYLSGQGSFLGKILFWLGMVHLVFYLAISLRCIKKRKEKSKTLFFSGLFIIYLVFLTMIVIEISINLASYFVFISSDLMDSIDLIFISLFLYSLGFRSFFTSLNKKRGTYAGTTITGDEKQILNGVIETLIKNEFYLDPDITLEEFAKKSGYHRNQISRFVNQELGLNFKDWVNNYRIEYFKNSLITKPEENILNLAFDAGFKSKSTYNTLFKKKYNLTPGSYRKKFKNVK